MDTATSTHTDSSMIHLDAARDSSVEPLPLAPLATAPARRHSWGAIISILLIVGIVVVGALYAWGERITVDTVGASTSAH